MNLTVGLAGSGADVIVSGTAEDEVNQALADVGASGGGSVTLLGGLYSIASSISMTYSNVTLQGAGAGQTILRTVPAVCTGTGRKKRLLPRRIRQASAPIPRPNHRGLIEPDRCGLAWSRPRSRRGGSTIRKC